MHLGVVFSSLLSFILLCVCVCVVDLGSLWRTSALVYVLLTFP